MTPPPEESLDQRKVFDAIPEKFDRWRLRYTPELFRFLVSRCSLGKGARCLEIGPGTGQATDFALDAGCDYTAIELGGHLAAFMRAKYENRPNFKLIEGDFERHPFERGSFDFVYSAAAIQWIEPRIAFAKSFDILKPGGYLAMFFLHSDYQTPNPALYADIQKVYDEHFRTDAPYRQRFPYLDAMKYGFETEERFSFPSTRRYTADEYIEYIGTHSDHIMLREECKDAFFGGVRDAILRHGNKIEFVDEFVLYLCRKPHDRLTPGTSRNFVKGKSVAAPRGAEPWLDTDVLVCGGGPAGVCAAIAAARNGARVLVVERGNCLGGMATRGLVGPFMTCYDKSGRTQIIRGLFNEIVERLVARGGAIHPRDCLGGTAFTSWIKVGHDHCTPFEPEALKLLLDEMCAEAGVKVLFHDDFAEPLMAGRRIVGARLFTKAGMRDVGAKVVIDATGDADVAFRAGAPTEFGDPAGRRVQPASMFFRIGNCDLAAITADIEAHLGDFYRKDGVNYRSLHWRVAEARAAGDWTLDRVSIGLFRGVREDEWSINTSRIMGVDSTDPESWSAAETVGRAQVDQIFRFFRKYVPGCADARLLCSGSTVGIRESRRILGEGRLTAEDCLEGRVPDDAILLASNSVDVHGRFGPLSNEYVAIRNGDWYGVSYRCLVPREVEGLLVAGRCLSAESEAAGAVRVMPPVMAMGEAAGTAAALCLKTGDTPRALDAGRLVAALRAQGAFLGATR